MECSRSATERVSPSSVRQIGFVVACLAVAVGCGTDAVGVGECRAFERVRCQAAAACGYPDVEECERFERDHCLHGVALDRISAIELDACAQDVGRAGRCAAEQGATTAANACSEPVLTAAPPPTACEVVLTPQLASSCTFLAPGSVGAGAPVVAPAASLPDAGSRTDP
jgi:hypothetical protein